MYLRVCVCVFVCAVCVCCVCVEEVDISITHVYILMQELCFQFYKTLKEPQKLSVTKTYF